MSAVTTDYLATIEQMAAGAVLRVDGVSWEEYEQLLADLGEGSPVRVFYAGLAVTEIWRVAKGQVRIFVLTG